MNALKHQKEKAFTLIELLIVIVVIGILASFGVSAYNGMTERANNAKTFSVVSQYIEALGTYAAKNNNTYPYPNVSYNPNDYGFQACLGEGYADYFPADDTPGDKDCWVLMAPPDAIHEQAWLNDALRPYLGSPLPMPALRLETQEWSGRQFVGAAIRFASTSKIDGVRYDYYLNYVLQGKKQKCEVGQLLNFDPVTSWPDYTANLTQPYTEELRNGTACTIKLPKP